MNKRMKNPRGRDLLNNIYGGAMPDIPEALGQNYVENQESQLPGEAFILW